MELAIRELTKKYKTLTALDRFTVTLHDGIYGLLGPNGAGKSTLLNLLTMNDRPTSGEISCQGEPIRKMGNRYLGLIGYAPQQQYLYPSFTGSRFMYYMAALKGMEKKQAEKEIRFFLHRVNLTEVADKKIGHYSGGMKQRLLVAQSMLGNPQILLLDEPSAGLDPQERVRLRELIREMGDERIVIVTTHIVSDIESIADEIIFLNKGVGKELVYDGEDSLENLYLKEFGEMSHD